MPFFFFFNLDKDFILKFFCFFLKVLFFLSPPTCPTNGNFDELLSLNLLLKYHLACEVTHLKGRFLQNGLNRPVTGFVSHEINFLQLVFKLLFSE